MNRIRVMAVDDSQRFLDEMKEGLEDFGEFEVVTDNNSRNAAARIQNRRSWPSGYPEVFLLDILMPEICGGELAQIIRDQEPLRRAPIIFVTGSDRVITEEELLKAGGKSGEDPILYKGRISMDHLRLMIIKLAGRSVGRGKL